MPSATNTTNPNPAPMAPMPNIGELGIPAASLSVTPVQGNRLEGDQGPSMGLPQSPLTPPAKPYLFTDIDPVYLVRSHSEQMLKGGAEPAGEAAMSAGWDAYNASFGVISAQEYDQLPSDKAREERLGPPTHKGGPTPRREPPRAETKPATK